jgi:hypothetical protein
MLCIYGSADRVAVSSKPKYIYCLHASGNQCLLLLLLLLLQNKIGIDGHVASLIMTSEDERQLLAENPALRQVYEAQVSCL